jgi:hypothetical protein
MASVKALNSISNFSRRHLEPKSGLSDENKHVPEQEQRTGTSVKDTSATNPKRPVKVKTKEREE